MRYYRMEQASNRNLKFAVVCLSALVVVLAVFVILLLPNGDYTGPDSNVTTQSSNNATPSGNGGGNTIEDSVSTITVKTPYCEMKYPSEYSDQLEIKESNENGIYTKQFLCTLSNGQYKLFAVHFGENASGDFFGYLTNDSEKVSVYIECYEIPEVETLSQEERRTYYHMMDGINQVARSISETSGYATH